MTDGGAKKTTALSWLDLLALGLVAFSLAALALVLCGVYSSPLALGLAALCCALVFVRLRPALPRFALSGHGARVLCLVLLALVLRLGPADWIMGGQDQGTYVNMAANLEREGSLCSTDRVRTAIDDPEILALYDKANRHSDMDAPIPGRYEGRYVLGVYVEDADASRNIFQFYPLHPAFMAAFETVFGAGRGAWSVVFFGLVAVAGLYLLALELTGSARAALLTGLLAALNPLLAYCSRFPVAESQFLALALLAMLYLSRAWRAAREGGGAAWPGTLAVLLAFCAFATRIHGFLYVPVLLALFLAARSRGVDGAEDPQGARGARVAARCLLGMLAAYAASLAYGVAVSFPYVYVVHGFALHKAFGEAWPEAMGSLAALAVVLVAVCGSGAGRRAVLRGVALGRRLVGPLTLAVVLYALYRTWLLACTDQLAWGWIHERWNVAGLGWVSTGHTLPGAVAMYLSPLVFGAWMLSLARRPRSQGPGLDAVALLLLTFWVYAAFFRFLVPYHYYFARYYATEIVPLPLLMACVLLDRWLGRRGLLRGLAWAVLVLAVVWSVPFTAAQLGGREGAGARESLARVAAHADRDDLILLDRQGFRQHPQIKVPLVYVFDRQVFDYEDDADRMRILTEYAVAQSQDVFVLSCRRQDASFLRLVDEITFRQQLIEQSFRIPVLYHDDLQPLYLYRVDKDWFAGRLVPRRIVVKELSEAALVGFYPDREWTNGEAALTGLGFTVPPGATRLVLGTYGHNPLRNDAKAVDPRVLVDGRELEFLGQDGDDHVFALPPDVGRIDVLGLVSRTFNPKDMGLNNDVRDLGLDVRAVYFR